MYLPSPMPLLFPVINYFPYLFLLQPATTYSTSSSSSFCSLNSSTSSSSIISNSSSTNRNTLRNQTSFKIIFLLSCRFLDLKSIENFKRSSRLSNAIFQNLISFSYFNWPAYVQSLDKDKILMGRLQGLSTKALYRWAGIFYVKNLFRERQNDLMKAIKRVGERYKRWEITSECRVLQITHLKEQFRLRTIPCSLCHEDLPHKLFTLFKRVHIILCKQCGEDHIWSYRATRKIWFFTEQQLISDAVSDLNYSTRITKVMKKRLVRDAFVQPRSSGEITKRSHLLAHEINRINQGYCSLAQEFRIPCYRHKPDSSDFPRFYYFLDDLVEAKHERDIITHTKSVSPHELVSCAVRLSRIPARFRTHIELTPTSIKWKRPLTPTKEDDPSSTTTSSDASLSPQKKPRIV